MKARMLCLLIVSSTLAAPLLAEGKERVNFHSAIEETTRDTSRLNDRIVKDLQENETVSFYNADWLNLRKRKKRALASVQVRLKVTAPPR